MNAELKLKEKEVALKRQQVGLKRSITAFKAAAGELTQIVCRGLDAAELTVRTKDNREPASAMLTGLLDALNPENPTAIFDWKCGKRIKPRSIVLVSLPILQNKLKPLAVAAGQKAGRMSSKDLPVFDTYVTMPYLIKTLEQRLFPLLQKIATHKASLGNYRVLTKTGLASLEQRKKELENEKARKRLETRTQKRLATLGIVKPAA